MNHLEKFFFDTIESGLLVNLLQDNFCVTLNTRVYTYNHWRNLKLFADTFELCHNDVAETCERILKDYHIYKHYVGSIEHSMFIVDLIKLHAKVTRGFSCWVFDGKVLYKD
jgi:hypothetical protein